LKINKKTMVLLSGSGDTVVWFRLEFLDKFLDQSFKVYVLVPDIRPELKKELDNRGIDLIFIKLERKGFNIINLFQSIVELIKIFRKIKPDIIFSYTHKAILSGSLAAKFSGFSNTYSLITGTGHLFDNKTHKEKLIKFLGSGLLRLGLKFNKIVFFQNPDDKKLFIENKIINSNKSRIVNGSGVNLNKFNTEPLPSSPIFMTMARLIKSKGLIEYAKSAREVKKTHPDARFLLYGYPDDHPDSIDENEIINNWHREYGVEYCGYADDPKAAIISCSVFVLLSYKEGTPRVNLEAMAMGRPIITTDAPGCRETVLDAVNGFLVPKYDYIETSIVMKKLIDGNLRSKMGKESRAFCESKFNVIDVNNKLLKLMNVI
jgi:glycosyltransferase involved in cell wall biosynthesis